ncbi:MAG: hypothetical protein HOV81_35375 [Kofleriaceae bacterium]|nr:hypothetical protein [Kofleriaceae bacterium]
MVGVALAGCYGPTISPGTACESVCPGELVCIDHVCREPGYTPDAAIAIDSPSVDGPPGDVDGDGVDDATDNCPSRANVDQHDEDADAIGDVCDPCPHLAGTAADGDGDGVGDACDPQPTIAKQQIVFFDPFTSDLPQWQHNSAVTRVGETLRAYASNGNAGFTKLTMMTGELRIVTGGTIVTTDATGEHALAVAYGFNGTNGDNYFYNEFYDAGDGTGGVVAITKATQGTYNGLTGAPYTGAMPTGAWSMQIDQSVTAQQIKFLPTLGGTTYGLQTASTAGTPSLMPSTTLTLLARDVDTRFDYVLVIKTTP